MNLSKNDIVLIAKQVKKALKSDLKEINDKLDANEAKTNGLEAGLIAMSRKSEDPYFRVFSPPYSYNLNSVSEPEIEFRSHSSFYDED